MTLNKLKRGTTIHRLQKNVTFLVQILYQQQYIFIL